MADPDIDVQQAVLQITAALKPFKALHDLQGLFANAACVQQRLIDLSAERDKLDRLVSERQAELAEVDGKIQAAQLDVRELAAKADRIVHEASAEAAKALTDAQAQAAKIVEDAQAQAATILTTAEAKADQIAQRTLDLEAQAGLLTGEIAEKSARLDELNAAIARIMGK